MAYVIAICGAGGKTTLAFKLAKKYIDENKTVAVTTTTHMWKEETLIDFYDLSEIQKNKIYFVGKKQGHNATPLDDNQYKILCEKFDIVIIEADGSRGMPLKVPNLNYEPVIPQNVNEIIVVYGLQSLHRKIKAVCHRYELYKNEIKKICDNITDDTLVDEKLLYKFYYFFYEKPLKDRYKNVKISLYLSNMFADKNYEKYNKLSFVILANNINNKLLLKKIDNKTVFEISVSEVHNAKKLISENLKKSFDKNIEVNIDIIYKDSNLLFLKDKYKDINFINNNFFATRKTNEKVAVEKNYLSDAIYFFDANMINLQSIEMMYMFLYFSASKKNIASLINKKFQKYVIYSKKYFDTILSLKDDENIDKVINDNMKDVFKYYVDTENINNINNLEDFYKEKAIYEKNKKNNNFMFIY